MVSSDETLVVGVGAAAAAAQPGPPIVIDKQRLAQGNTITGRAALKLLAKRKEVQFGMRAAAGGDSAKSFAFGRLYLPGQFAIALARLARVWPFHWSSVSYQQVSEPCAFGQTGERFVSESYSNNNNNNRLLARSFRSAVNGEPSFG